VDLNYNSRVLDQVGGNRSAVANLALGAEYSLSKAWTLRGGMFTDLANTPDLVQERANQPEHVDLYGVSMSIRRLTMTSTSVTLGGSYAAGSGQAQIVGGRNDMQHVDSNSWAVFLSTSSAY
jgi:long-chain fatty acid transport protein